MASESDNTATPAMSGYFLVAHAVVESSIWRSSPDLIKLWFYLLSEARFNPEPKKYPGFELKRGELLTSLSDISKANEWIEGRKVQRWSRQKVSRLIHQLSIENRIAILADTYGTHLKIVNYERYQNPGRYKSDSDGTSVEHQWNDSGHNSNNVNNVNKGNNGEDAAVSDPTARAMLVSQFKSKCKYPSTNLRFVYEDIDGLLEFYDAATISAAIEKHGRIGARPREIPDWIEGRIQHKEDARDRLKRNLEAIAARRAANGQH